MIVTPPSATFNLAIPNSAPLVGLELYAQAASLSSGINSLGVITSNRAKAHLGR